MFIPLENMGKYSGLRDIDQVLKLGQFIQKEVYIMSEEKHLDIENKWGHLRLQGSWHKYKVLFYCAFETLCEVACTSSKDTGNK